MTNEIVKFESEKNETSLEQQCAVYGIKRQQISDELFSRVREKKDFVFNEFYWCYSETDEALRRRLIDHIKDFCKAIPGSIGSLEKSILEADKNIDFVCIKEHFMVDTFENKNFFKRILLKLAGVERFKYPYAEALIASANPDKINMEKVEEVVNYVKPATINVKVELLIGVFR